MLIKPIILQLVRRVVSVLHGVPRLIGDARKIPRTIVSIRFCRSVMVCGLRQPLARVVAVLSRVAVAVGARNLVARVVVGEGHVALHARHRGHVPSGVVGVGARLGRSADSDELLSPASIRFTAASLKSRL